MPSMKKDTRRDGKDLVRGLGKVTDEGVLISIRGSRGDSVVWEIKSRSSATVTARCVQMKLSFEESMKTRISNYTGSRGRYTGRLERVFRVD